MISSFTVHLSSAAVSHKLRYTAAGARRKKIHHSAVGLLTETTWGEHIGLHCVSLDEAALGNKLTEKVTCSYPVLTLEVLPGVDEAGDASSKYEKIII